MYVKAFKTNKGAVLVMIAW